MIHWYWVSNNNHLQFCFYGIRVQSPLPLFFCTHTSTENEVWNGNVHNRMTFLLESGNGFSRHCVELECSFMRYSLMVFFWITIYCVIRPDSGRLKMKTKTWNFFQHFQQSVTNFTFPVLCTVGRILDYIVNILVIRQCVTQRILLMQSLGY